MPRRNRTDMEIALSQPAHLRAVPQPVGGLPPAEDEPDESLLVRVADRDRIAFETLYQRYIRSVYGLALRRLRDHFSRCAWLNPMERKFWSAPSIRLIREVFDMYPLTVQGVEDLARDLS